MKTSVSNTLLPVVSGVISGIIVVVVGSLYLKNDYSTESQAPNAGHSPTMSSNSRTSVNLAEQNREVLKANDERMRSLEQRLSMLATKNNTTDNPEQDEISAANQADAEVANQLSPEDAKAADLQWWEDSKVAFKREPIDRNWAGATQSLFEEDLAQLAANQGDYSIVSTECRTNSCAIVLRWPSYGAASTGFTELLHHAYSTNCAKSTLLPEPGDATDNQPYEMTILFDCSESRQQS
ncbi:hypothetical protein GO003_015190 [Methylicorpusculum oleiharenae]|uniref:hypothetical protein n=1 Tax=Methylicorpusculum oleiharenae TaxID=1338687 RepID=UPI001357F754|nr:hypothetical protein [Methylicorpusculum oleiharenae]MCD2451734.1 hypothetical protein [Methylicorpusculum oleiharenae]